MAAEADEPAAVLRSLTLLARYAALLRRVRLPRELEGSRAETVPKVIFHFERQEVRCPGTS